MTVSKFLFGATFENEIRVGFPLMDILTDREDGEGSEYIDMPDGSTDTWRQNKMFAMQAEARWIPDGPGTNPVQTQLSGPVSWEEFVDWARDGRPFRFLPDENLADFYVDNTYLVEPRKGFGSLSPDIKRNVPIRLRNPAKSFHEAMRGIMFEYAPGTSLTDPVAYTMTRAGSRTYRGSPANLFAALGATAAANVLRDRHYINALKVALFEMARTQVVTDPENFGAWTLDGTPILTAGQADPFGGTGAYLLNDDDAAVGERIRETVTFTADGVKAFAIFMRAGTSDDSFFGIFDTTAAVWRHQVKVTWAAGVPTLSTVLGGGTLLPVVNWGAGWWLLVANANGVIAANTNTYFVGPTQNNAADTGTTFVFGANAWNSSFPSSYQGPGIASPSAADLFTAPLLYAVQPIFSYQKFIESGQAALDSATATSRGVVMVGSGAGSRVMAFKEGASGFYRALFDNGVGVQVRSPSGAGLTPAVGDIVELLTLLYSDGSIEQHQALNGGAPTLYARSASNPWLNRFFSGQQIAHATSVSGAADGVLPLITSKVGVMTMGSVIRNSLTLARAA